MGRRPPCGAGQRAHLDKIVDRLHVRQVVVVDVDAKAEVEAGVAAVHNLEGTELWYAWTSVTKRGADSASKRRPRRREGSETAEHWGRGVDAGGHKGALTSTKLVFAAPRTDTMACTSSMSCCFSSSSKGMYLRPSWRGSQFSVQSMATAGSPELTHTTLSGSQQLAIEKGGGGYDGAQRQPRCPCQDHLPLCHPSLARFVLDDEKPDLRWRLRVSLRGLVYRSARAPRRVAEATIAPDARKATIGCRVTGGVPRVPCWRSEVPHGGCADVRVARCLQGMLRCRDLDGWPAAVFRPTKASGL